MEGLAAMRIRSEGWKPLVLKSRSANPVARPVTVELELLAREILSRAFMTMVEIGVRSLPRFTDSSWKTCFSSTAPTSAALSRSA